MRNYNFSHKQNGLSLIELMVALVLGIVVVFGVTQTLLSLSQSSRIQSRNADLLETSDAALSYLAFRMRNALSTPCERYAKLEADDLTIQGLVGTVDGETITSVQSTQIQNLINGFGISVTPRQVARNFNGTNSNFNTDDITLVGIGDRLMPSTDVTLASTNVTINGQFILPRAGNRTLYAITDCERMDIFRAARQETGGVTTLTFLQDASNPANSTNIEAAYRVADLSIISPIDVSTIAVTDTRRLVDRTFFRNSGGALMDNVELIRILFGVDNTDDGVTDQYIVASQLAALPATSTVTSADIYVVVQVPNADSGVAQSYTLSIPDTTEAITGVNNALPTMETITVTDQVLRKVFMRSVVFRNNAITL